MLSGTAPDGPTVDKAVTIAKQFGPDVINSVSVHAPQQVMLEVRFVEASRQAGRDLGVQWNVFGQRRWPTSAIVADQLGDGGGICRADQRRPPASTVRRRSPWPACCPARAPFGVIVGKLLAQGLADRRDHQGARAEGRRPPPRRAESGGAFGRHRELPRRRRISRSRCPARSAQITIDYKHYGVGLAFTPTVLERRPDQPEDRAGGEPARLQPHGARSAASPCRR